MAKSGVKPLIFLIAVSVMAWVAGMAIHWLLAAHSALTWSSTTPPNSASTPKDAGSHSYLGSNQLFGDFAGQNIFHPH